MQCEERDLVWSRRCQKKARHIDGATAAERLHKSEKPGDVVTWGGIPDIKEYEGIGE